MYGSFCSVNALTRLVARDLSALAVAPLGDLALHLGLDPLEVGLVDRLGELEVVVEAVRDRRADGDLDAGIQAANRLGEQVRGRVAEHVERVRVVGVTGRQDLEVLSIRERQPEVPRRAVDARQHGLLGELRADRPGRVEAGRAVGELELGVVRQDDLHRRRQG